MAGPGWIKSHIAGPGLKLMLEGAFSELVELVPPDGIDITTNEDGDPLRGTVIRDFEAFDPESGDTSVVTRLVVTLRKSALRVVPEQGQVWVVRIQARPQDDAVSESYTINTDEAIMGGATAGFINLNLKSFEQTP